MNFKLLLLSSLLILSGCSLLTEYVDRPYPVRYQINCPIPPPPRGIIPKPIAPTVIVDKHDNWWVALSSEHYLNLAINTDETIRYIKDQKSTIRYYRQCITEFNTEIDALNTEG